MRERFDMYIVTCEELDQQTEEWEKRFDLLETGIDVKDCVEYLIECEASGVIRNIRIWDADELMYEKKVEVKVSINW